MVISRPPIAIKASAEDVDKKRICKVPTIIKLMLLSTKILIRVAIPNNNSVIASPISNSVSSKLLSLKLNQSIGNKSRTAPAIAIICPAR